MQPKSIIGAVLVAAAIGGYVPGVPGLSGGPPAEEQAQALPPPPEIAEMETGEPVAPDDGLIRLIVTPTAEVSPTNEPTTGETEMDSEPDPGTTADQREQAVDGPTSETTIDPDRLAELTNGAVLQVDELGRSWAVWPNGTRVALGGSAENKSGAEDPQLDSRPSPEGAGDETDNLPGGVTETGATPTMPETSLGHPTMDAIRELTGVHAVHSLGDGTFAVTLEDPSVLDGLAVDVAEDPAMGITAEPYEGYQWALDNTGSNLDGIGANPMPPQTADADIDAVEAWPEARGAGIVVAVIDSGVDFAHPDLAHAEWTNTGENCLNGIDDDANGYVDDCHGWDFAYEDKTPYNPGAHAHGTHVAGIIAAGINNVGVAGVAPDAKVMDLNVGTITASGQPGITTSAVARAIRYAADNGAHIINLSLGTPPGSPRAGSTPVETAIEHAESLGVIVVAAAGNDGVSLDGAASWPASYEHSNMITVGASSPADTRAGFSNWGSVVDLFAPGELILSTAPIGNGEYLFMSGTSQAAPIVAATAALVLGKSPFLSPEEVRSHLVSMADRHDTLDSYVRNGVRVNASTAVGRSEPRYELADLTVSVDGLAGAHESSPIEAELDIAVPADHYAQPYRWAASIFLHSGGETYALVDLAVMVDGLAATTDKWGSVDLALAGSGQVSLSVDLPGGDYALVVEAVAIDGEPTRLGDPAVVAFSVGEEAATAPDADTGDPATTPGEDTSPIETQPQAPGRPVSEPTDPGPEADSAATSPPSPQPQPQPDLPDTSPVPEQNGPGPEADPDNDEDPASAEPGAPEPSGPPPAESEDTPPPSNVGGGPAETGPAVPGTPPAPGDAPGTAPDATRDAATGETNDPGDVPVDQIPEPEPVTAGSWSLERLSPRSGPVDTMTLVHLSGQFPESVYVWFGDAPGTVLGQTPNSLWVLTPPMADAGTVDVSLRRTGQGTVITLPAAYTFVPVAQAPLPGVDEPPPDAGESPPPDADPGSTQLEPSEPADPDAGADGAAEPAVDVDADKSPPRQERVVASPNVVELHGGLRGVRVVEHDPTAGAPTCTSNPCRLG